MFIETHAHLHFAAYRGDVDGILHRASEAEVRRFITVGVDTSDSRAAVQLAWQRENVYASVGIHPHAAAEAEQGMAYLRDLAGERKVVAIGECGLDYFKSTSSKPEQERALRLQIELALERKLPLIFHVRDAFEDFWRIVDSYPPTRGVIHCFSAGRSEMDQALSRGYSIALNGIMTFTKDEEQLAAAKAIPLEHLVLETDSPYLAPKPYRGKRNEPSYIPAIADFLAELRGETVARLAKQTTHNASQLFWPEES